MTRAVATATDSTALPRKTSKEDARCNKEPLLIQQSCRFSCDALLRSTFLNIHPLPTHSDRHILHAWLAIERRVPLWLGICPTDAMVIGFGLWTCGSQLQNLPTLYIPDAYCITHWHDHKQTSQRRARALVSFSLSELHIRKQ